MRILTQKFQASLKAVLALSFAEVASARDMLDAVLGSSDALVSKLSEVTNVETLPVGEKTSLGRVLIKSISTCTPQRCSLLVWVFNT
jgi:hypothetical protein